MMDGIIRIGTEIETKKFDKQINNLEREVQEKQKRLSIMLQIQGKGLKDTDFTKDIEELQASIEKTENSIVSLTNQKRKLEESSKTNLKDGFEGAFKSAKKLIKGVIGVTAAYSLIRKATSAYLATDSKTTSQAEANWIGLGAIMGPVIEYITQLMRKAVTAVLHFMSVLTGTNYVAKANEAILRKQAKATNDLTKATDKYTASFDEMNVLNDNASISGYGTDDVSASLFDINDLSENTRKAIEKVAEALKPVYEILKNIVKFGLDHPDIILGIIGGIGLLSALNKIIGFAGVGGALGTGLAGILGVLLAIASIGVITISIKTIVEDVTKMNEEMENARELNDSVARTSHEVQKEFRETAKEGKLTKEKINNMVIGNKELVKSSLNVVKAHGDEYSSMSALDKAFNSLTGHTGALGRMSNQYIGVAFDEIYTMSELYKQGLLNNEQIEDYKNAMLNFTNVVGKSGTSTAELTKQFGLNNSQAKIVQSQYNIIATELYRMYKNGDSTVDILSKMPKEVRTTIENNFDKNLDLLDDVYAMLEKIPGYKRVNVETKVTADTSDAKSKLERLFQGVGNITSIFDKTFGAALSMSFKNIRLARGGIVNNPGRGVSIGTNIIAGEAGPEAVLPLNEQTMGMLAKLITDKMVVNLTNINQMNGRVISRELQRVQNDSDFAYNR